ncbi:MAG: DUF2974 domain-containing protein [Bacilli bacterium]|nr:DUF2974 domain-containing protein [Bacilli bacterium]
MNVVDYLKEYKDVSFKEEPFNELDALLLSLMGYFPFDLIDKKKITSFDVLEFLKSYQPVNTSERKLLDIYVLKILCNSERFKDIKFLDYAKKRSNEAIEQFQAVTIAFKDFVFVSYCGTDATVLGWREDFNMAFLDIVPAEIDAIQYINEQRKKHPFKTIYIGGHSKGGRLAIRAGKEVFKKNNLGAVFSFDGPNFTDSFYDYQYDEMKSLIYEFAPNESIIGRLIKDRKKIIVESNAKGINQHDAYSWQVDGNHFVHMDKYTPKSDKIVKTANGVLEEFDNETKSVFVNTLFDLLEKLNIQEFRDDKYNLNLIKNALSNLRIEWKNTPKEHRIVIRRVLLSILLIAIKN